MNTHVCIVLCIVILCPGRSDAFLDWLFGSREESGGDSAERKSVIRAVGLRFEVPTVDDKFIQMKNALDELSPLDGCYHIVVYKLKKRCGELSEEDLGKLSVQLLNCQSAAEERPTYMCTDEMSLAECTKDMDSTTWNSYQIVGNRARALCYSTQQQQFRRLTELTVNQLISSAHGQLEYLKELQSGQEQLHEISTDTIRKLYESQSDLLGNQHQLRASQDDVLAQIHANMKDLSDEKAMIATGNRELADLTNNIQRKLDETTDRLQQQDETQTKSHQKIIEDLTFIQEKAHAALLKLDESSRHLVRNHDEMLGHYAEMHGNMVRMNATVTHLLTTVRTMQRHLDEKINWFSHLLNMADDKLSLLTCGAMHVGYFLSAALAVSFLQTPAFTRVILFVLVSLNASMEIQCGHSLDFLSITLFMFLVCAANWLYCWWRKRQQTPPSSANTGPFMFGSLPAPSATGSQQDSDAEEGDQIPDTTTSGTVPGGGGGGMSSLSPVELKQLTSTLGRLYNSLKETPQAGGGGDNPKTSTPNIGSHSFVEPRPSTSSAFTPYRRPEQARPDSSTMPDHVAKVRKYLMENLDETPSSVGDEDRSERASTPRRRGAGLNRPPSRSSTSTNRSLCQGFTKAGLHCRLGAVNDTGYCYRHKDLVSS